jgi:II/X family phage/plasmid replication protein
VIDQSGELLFRKDRGRIIEGSHDARVLVWSHPQFPDYVHVSGNPAKFLQGHNVFGSNDIRALSVALLEKVAEHISTPPTPEDRADWLRGNIGVCMVDITESWRFSSRDQVRNAIRSMEQHSRLRHRGRGYLTRGATLYFGKHSRRWALKLYCKGDELEAPKHRIASELPHRIQIIEHADCLLRAELRLMPMELQRLGLGTIWDWTDTTPSRVHSEAMSKLEISEAAMLKADVLEGLPPRLNAAYQLWVDGHDLRTVYKRPTFYRYRSELLKHGIDIAICRGGRDVTNVVPLAVVLHGYPDAVPQWAHGTPVYFQPKAA